MDSFLEKDILCLARTPMQCLLLELFDKRRQLNIRHLLSYRNKLQLMDSLSFEHFDKSENWQEQSTLLFKWNSCQNFMFKYKSWSGNSAVPLKIFHSNIYLKFYLIISSQQLSSHYKSYEGRTSRSGNAQKQISLNTTRFCPYNFNEFIFLYFMPQFLQFCRPSYCI